MTPRQARFVEEYLVDLNASAAARRAGYSAKRADAIGHENLRKPEIAAAISVAQAERSKRTKIDADWVLRTLAGEKTADLADLYGEDGRMLPVKQWPEVWRRGLVVGVESFEEYSNVDGERVATGMVRKVKLSDRIKHIELIGRHVTVQAFKERHEHGGPNGGPIPVAAVSMTPEEFQRIAAEVAAKT